VVFLHGVAGSRRTYDWVPPTVAGHPVVRPDFRGHGAAPRTPDAYLIDDYAADAIEVLRSVGPAFVVGHSLGGVAAWCAAQAVPELVLGAVLEDPPLLRGTAEGHASNVAIPHFVELREQAQAMQAGGLSEHEALAQVEDPGSFPDAVAARAYSLLHLDVAVLDPVIDGSLLAGTDVESPVNVPVRILAAELDPAFAAEHEARLAVSHPDVTVERIAGAGHLIHDAKASRARYLDEVERFLTAQAAAARS
jgi:pimeloyl-ACP methyl ester carboxylesterase